MRTLESIFDIDKQGVSVGDVLIGNITICEITPKYIALKPTQGNTIDIGWTEWECIYCLMMINNVRMLVFPRLGIHINIKLDDQKVWDFRRVKIKSSNYITLSSHSKVLVKNLNILTSKSNKLLQELHLNFDIVDNESITFEACKIDANILSSSYEKLPNSTRCDLILKEMYLYIDQDSPMKIRLEEQPNNIYDIVENEIFNNWFIKNKDFGIFISFSEYNFRHGRSQAIISGSGHWRYRQT